jgi:hypothetical protein
MKVDSKSSSLEGFAEIASLKTRELGFAIPPDEQPQGSDGLPPDGVISFHWESGERQPTGPDHVQSTKNCTPETDPSRSDSLQIVETDFAELNNGTLVDLVQDSGNPSHTLLAVWKDGKLRYLDRFEHGSSRVPTKVPTDETKATSGVTQALNAPRSAAPTFPTIASRMRARWQVVRPHSDNPCRLNRSTQHLLGH